MAGFPRAFRVGAVVCCCAAVVGAASAASPPSSSGPQQYVELVPGASGATVAPAPSTAASGAHQYLEVVPSAGGGAGSNPLGPTGVVSPSASPLDAVVNAVATG